MQELRIPHRSRIRILALGLGWLAGPVVVQAQPQLAAPETAQAPALQWTLGDGLHAEWGAFRARLRPRFHFDYVDPRFSDIASKTGGTFDEHADVRRARLLGDFGFREGSALGPWSLRAQIDFADSQLDWKDFALAYSGLPAFQASAATQVRVGHFREPFGLEAMTSVSHLPFIERSAASSAFTPGRSRGVEWSEQAERSLLQLGWFRRAAGAPFPSELTDETALTARALWQHGRGPRGPLGLVQLGGSLSVRQPGADPIRFDARTGSRLLARVLDTGRVQAESVNDVVTLGLESLHQWDQSTLIVEAFGAYVDNAAVPQSPHSHAFLAGGHIGFFTFLSHGHAARWNQRRGGIKAASVPDLLHGTAPSKGALEAAARLTWVNLNNGALDGGQSIDLEIGFNWYAQPTTRVMLHWLGAHVNTPGNGDAFGQALLARIQIQL